MPRPSPLTSHRAGHPKAVLSILPSSPGFPYVSLSGLDLRSSPSPRMTPPTSLEHLPSEILRLICSHLCAHCQGQTPLDRASGHAPSPAPHVDTFDSVWLAARSRREQSPLALLARTSRRMRLVASEVLYHYASDELWTEPPFVSYVAAVRRRPGLASRVRELDVGRVIRYRDEEEPEAAAGLDEAVARLRGPSIGQTEDWLFGDFMGSMVQLLLPEVRNLTTLRLRDEAVKQVRRFADQELYPDGLRLLALRDLELVHGDAVSGFTFLDVQPLLMGSPNLESLALTKCISWSSVPATLPLHNLQSLSISNSSISRSSLACLLAQTPLLRSFRLSAGGLTSGLPIFAVVPAVDEIVARDLTRLLVCRKATLVDVDVDLTGSVSFPCGRFRKRDVMRSWRDFAGLRRLCINSSDVYERACVAPPEADDGGDEEGWAGNGSGDEVEEGDYLPPSGRLRRLAEMIPDGLRRLEVRGGIFTDDALLIVDKIRAGQFAKLTEVSFGSGYGGDLGSVRTAFEREGVRCLFG